MTLFFKTVCCLVMSVWVVGCGYAPPNPDNEADGGTVVRTDGGAQIDPTVDPNNGPPTVPGGSVQPDGGGKKDSVNVPPTPSGGPIIPTNASLAGQTYQCPKVALPSGGVLDRYNKYFDAKGRPQTDADMNWKHDPTMLEVINTVRFGPLNGSVASGTEALLKAGDFLPENHGPTNQLNLALFKAKSLTNSSAAWLGFNARDFVPGAATRYKTSIAGPAFVSWTGSPWTELSMARCPDCIDGIITFAAKPADAMAWHHDFFKIFEVRFVTDRAVDAASPQQRAQTGDGRLFVSRPFKMIAAMDSSGSLQYHLNLKMEPFFASNLSNIALNYRAELPEHMYHLVQSGNAKVKSSYRTGAVAILIRNAPANDVPILDVCKKQPINAAIPKDQACHLHEWGTWRCALHDGREAVQVCRQVVGKGFKWATSSFVNCAQCKVNPLSGCTW